ncbi:arabinosyltransferase domain-containing protein [Corynebacterium bovis]|uniref:arabinosyltransferase domain-containing protein n=1 Tax=Corynebacterium bovis TaxID=36808 RepID=UPI0016398B6D
MSRADEEPELPGTAAPGGERSTRERRSRLKTVAAVAGLLGFVLFCLTPFLPVKQTQSSFSWPQGGDLRSVTAPLTAYQPEKLDITLPVAEARHLNEGQTTVLSTVPRESEDPTLRGMFVRSTDDGLDVVLRNIVPLSVSTSELASLPDDAVLRITSDAERTHVWIPDAKDSSGRPLEGAIDDDIRPMVTGIYSEMTDTPENTSHAVDAGLTVDVTVDSRFTSSPGVLKYAAMWAGVAFTVVALWALHRMDVLDGRSRPGSRFLPRNWWRPRWLDAVVGFFLLAWYVIGANTADDGYLLTMARASRESGYMSNYYRWFGVSESPFGAPYYDLMAVMTHVSTASVWMRLPGLIAGVLTWLILSREVLPRLGTKVNQRRVAHWTTAAVFLVFWMTYNNGLRPEPVIALGALLTWVSIERSIATGRLLPAAFGVIFAAFSLAAGPTGLMAVAAILAGLSSLIRIVIRRLPLLDAPRGSSRRRIAGAVTAQVAPFLAAGTAVLIAVFGDQTPATVMEAIRLRGDVGPALAWYEEPTRYTELLKQTVDGSFPRRFAVIIMILCFIVVVASMLRNRRVPGTAHGPAIRLTLVIIGTAFFMTFTPTKWTHHFGVYAGLAAALAGLASVAASHMALRSQRNRVLFIGAVLMIFAFTLSGTNGWWYISSFGVPWYDKSIQVHGIEASTVMLVIALLVLAWGVLVRFRGDIRTARAQTESEVRDVQREEARRAQRFTGIAASPIAVVTALVVVFSFGSLAKGFVSQWPAYSVGKGNLEALTGNTCGLASDVRVETDTNDSILPVADGSPLKDSLTTKVSRGFEPNNIPNRIEEEDGDGSASQTSTVSTDAYETSGDQSGQDTGTTGGLQADTGVNGSHAHLPFGLDPHRVPVVGSYTDGLQLPAETTTKWFTLPERSPDQPLISISAAGRIAYNDLNGVAQYGQDVTLEYGRRTSGTDPKSGDVNVDWMGSVVPMDIGTAPEWRNLRVPMSEIPDDADVVRIRVVDMNVTKDQWVAVTPPRAPHLQSMNDYVGSTAPTLLDWSTALQFPCQRPYDHWAGVAEVPEFRVSPDHQARKIHSPVQDYYGGGAGGLVQMTTRSEELPTYLVDDWQRDWGVLDKLTPFPNGQDETPKPVTLDTAEVTRSGMWSPGPMKHNMS